MKGGIVMIYSIFCTKNLAVKHKMLKKS